jgi:hypothetical protein
MCGLHSGPHHLRKQVHIVISLTRHLFANSVQDFQEFWATIHGCVGSWVLGLGSWVLGLGSLAASWNRITKTKDQRSKFYITLSVASDTRNSGVTIIGT